MVKTIRDFKIAYRRAIDNDQQDFDFDGCCFLCSYARYMIEYFYVKDITDDTEFESVVEIE